MANKNGKKMPVPAPRVAIVNREARKVKVQIRLSHVAATVVDAAAAGLQRGEYLGVVIDKALARRGRRKSKSKDLGLKMEAPLILESAHIDSALKHLFVGIAAALSYYAQPGLDEEQQEVFRRKIIDPLAIANYSLLRLTGLGKRAGKFKRMLPDATVAVCAQRWERIKQNRNSSRTVYRSEPIVNTPQGKARLEVAGVKVRKPAPKIINP